MYIVVIFVKKQSNKIIKLNINKNQKKYLAITTMCIIVYLLIINIYVSHAYYHSNTTFPLINAVVGNAYEDKYDYIVLIHKEDTVFSTNDEKVYNVVNEIPLENYTYNNYMCKNNSVISFDEVNKNISIISTTKDICSIFFNYSKTGD